MNDLERHPGINMATPTPDTPEEAVSNWRYDLGLAVALTFILSQSVIHSWHAYRLFDKCFSVFVLLSVLTLPWDGIRMKKRTHNVELRSVCLLLLMVYFLARLPL
jgi:hypothetical protein